VNEADLGVREVRGHFRTSCRDLAFPGPAFYFDMLDFFAPGRLGSENPDPNA
jgi:hypothetical protein